MKKRLFAFIPFSVFISSCGGSDGDVSPLVGTWETEKCELASDLGSTTVNSWVKGIYEFTSSGRILLGKEIYEDSNCVVQKQLIDTSESPDYIRYYDRGEVLLEEGIDGHELTIDMDSGSQPMSISAFFTINGGELCFSRAYIFEPSRFGMYESANPEIDFDNCLRKP